MLDAHWDDASMSKSWGNFGCNWKYVSLLDMLLNVFVKKVLVISC